MEFTRSFLIVIALALLMIIAFLISNKIYLSVFKDLVNGAIVISIFFILSLIISTKKELEIYIMNLIKMIVLFAFIISLLRFLELFEIYSSNPYHVVSEVAHVPDEANGVDSNFALLPTFFGIFGIVYLFSVAKSKTMAVILNISLMFFFINIILSGSRRGLMLLIALVAIIILIRIFLHFYKNSFLDKISSGTFSIIISFFFTLIILTLFFYFANYRVKNYTFEILGSKNMVKAKYSIVYNLFRYITVFDNDANFTSIHDKIWDVRFYPEDPDSGWGTRYHKTIYPLTGNNVEIVPTHAKGYLMDHTCDGNYYPGNDVCESYTIASNHTSKKGESYKVSVFCFVSDSVDIDVVCLTVAHSLIFSNQVVGNTAANYDLNRKGTWQKLEINYLSDIEGNILTLMTFWKQGVKNFSNLNGHIIFAYPTHEKNNSSGNSLIRNKLYNRFPNNSYTFDFGKKQLHFANIFPTLNILLPDSINKDPDPIRKYVSNLVSEDTTYFPYKSDIVLTKISNEFLGTRVSRWDFALKIFSKEYNVFQKVFGGGFNFLNWYGYFFNNDRNRIDYPHNPFLSVLLYSGILGLLLYIIFIFKVFYYYVKYFAEYKILVLFFITTFFFSFFSAGNPFDPPVMGFFVLLPFFIHLVFNKKSLR